MQTLASFEQNSTRIEVNWELFSVLVKKTQNKFTINLIQPPNSVLRSLEFIFAKERCFTWATVVTSNSLIPPAMRAKAEEARDLRVSCDRRSSPWWTRSWKTNKSGYWRLKFTGIANTSEYLRFMNICLSSVVWKRNTASAKNCVCSKLWLYSLGQRKKLHTKKKIVIFYLSSSISHFFISLLFKLTPSSGSDKKATEVWRIDSRCKPKADQRIPNLGQLPSLVKKIIQEKVKTYAQSWFFNPSRPNLSMYILPTVLYSFPKVLRSRFGLTIFSWWSFLLSCNLNVWFRGDPVWRN